MPKNRFLVSSRLNYMNDVNDFHFKIENNIEWFVFLDIALGGLTFLSYKTVAVL